MSELADALGHLSDLLGDRLQRDQPIGQFTTYRVGGVADCSVLLDDADELAAVAASVASLRRSGADVPVLVIGQGSNLLVADDGFAGLVIRLGGDFARIEIPTWSPGATSVTVRAGGAVKLPVLAEQTATAGLTGFEWGKGVPGSVGGAVRMNAGGHGSDTAATLVGVRLVDLSTGEDVEVEAAALDLGYRSSSLRPDQVVARADLQLAPAPGGPDVLKETLKEIVTWRRANQPGGRNAGSVFTNPSGASAGELLDRAGCKGLRHGSASISAKHANFIIVDEGGAAADVFDLMVTAAAQVHRTLGVRLHPETCLVGFPDFDAAVDGAVDAATDQSNPSQDVP